MEIFFESKLGVIYLKGENDYITEIKLLAKSSSGKILNNENSDFLKNVQNEIEGYLDKKINELSGGG